MFKVPYRIKVIDADNAPRHERQE